MTFMHLFNKIGKQEISVTQNTNVVAVINIDGVPTTIPLTLKVQLDSNQKMWFVEDTSKPRGARSKH